MGVCNVCGSRNHYRIFRKNGFDIVKCRNCSLAFVDPQPNDKELAKFYEKDFFFDSKDNKLSFYKDYFKEMKDNPFIKRRIIRLHKLKKKGNLLDMGCAHGFFMKKASKYWDTRGIEISKHAADYARKKLKLNVENTSLEKYNPKEKFDIITWWGVVDHLKDPSRSVNKIYSLLEKNGIFAFDYNNFGSFRAKINGISWRPLNPPFHLYYFSIKHLKKILKKAGFRKIIIKGKNEIGLKDVTKNPDINKTKDLKPGTLKFKHSFGTWVSLYYYGLMCWFSEKTGIGDITIGSQIEIYAMK